MTDINEYIGSDDYIKTVKEIVKNLHNKTFWGGVSSGGYTRYETPEGEIISIPLQTKSTKK